VHGLSGTCDRVSLHLSVSIPIPAIELSYIIATFLSSELPHCFTLHTLIFCGAAYAFTVFATFKLDICWAQKCSVIIQTSAHFLSHFTELYINFLFIFKPAHPISSTPPLLPYSSINALSHSYSDLPLLLFSFSFLLSLMFLSPILLLSLCFSAFSYHLPIHSILPVSKVYQSPFQKQIKKMEGSKPRFCASMR
jgi:hypothetical protein